jgi:hypothetical protein
MFRRPGSSKKLQKENTELKKMLAESLLKNRVLEAVCEKKKVVSPGHRRAAAQQVVAAGLCSQRVACRLLRLARSTYGYRGRPPTAAEQQLRKRLHELSLAHPRYGYRRIAALLRQEGWPVGKPDGKLTDLRPGESLAISYDEVNGVNIINCIAPGRAQKSSVASSTTQSAVPPQMGY